MQVVRLLQLQSAHVCLTFHKLLWNTDAHVLFRMSIARAPHHIHTFPHPKNPNFFQMYSQQQTSGRIPNFFNLWATGETIKYNRF